MPSASRAQGRGRGGFVGQLSGLVLYVINSYACCTALLLLAELALNGLIVWRVNYTEIDWKAYMQEVEGVIVHHDYNYTNLRGGTGPLVYPAGFVYFYAALHALTDSGTAILRAQLLFVGMYLLCFALVCAIYAKAAPKDFKPVYLLLLCCSKRIHSIFVLRLFNDGPTMLLLYAAVLCFLHRKWGVGVVVFNLAFSMKLNIILFAPALGLALIADKGLWKTAQYVLLSGLIQVAMALPFLQADAMAYITAAFNLGRVFTHKWSVNFKWVPCAQLPPARQQLLLDCEGPFTSRAFGLACLAMHVTLLLCFAYFRWCRSWARDSARLRAVLSGGGVVYSAQQVATMLLSANFIGLCFARSLHFQFYVWYFHSLPFLVWSTRLPLVCKLALLLAIEVSWNPWYGETSCVASSALLTASHAVLLLALWDGLRAVYSKEAGGEASIKEA